MKPQCGFTLLEMLAALAVLALCATVLLGAFGQSARALQQSAGADRLSLAAASVIDSLDDGPLQAGRQQGQWDGVKWVCDIAVVPSVPGSARLFRLDLTLHQGARRVHVSTLRVRSAGATP